MDKEKTTPQEEILDLIIANAVSHVNEKEKKAEILSLSLQLGLSYSMFILNNEATILDASSQYKQFQTDNNEN